MNDELEFEFYQIKWARCKEEGEYPEDWMTLEPSDVDVFAAAPAAKAYSALYKFRYIGKGKKLVYGLDTFTEARKFIDILEAESTDPLRMFKIVRITLSKWEVTVI